MARPAAGIPVCILPQGTSPRQAPQERLNFLPLPQGQGSLRPGRGAAGGRAWRRKRRWTPVFVVSGGGGPGRAGRPVQGAAWDLGGRSRDPPWGPAPPRDPGPLGLNTSPPKFGLDHPGVLWPPCAVPYRAGRDRQVAPREGGRWLGGRRKRPQRRHQWASRALGRGSRPGSSGLTPSLKLRIPRPTWKPDADPLERRGGPPRRRAPKLGLPG